MKFFWIAAGIILFCLIALTATYILAVKLFNTAFVRSDPSYQRRRKGRGKAIGAEGLNRAQSFGRYREQGAESLALLPYQKLEISSADGLTLSGRLIKNPRRAADKLLVAVHGYRGSGLADFGGQSEYWFDRGFDIFLPDNRAHGQSEGEYIGFGVTDGEDLLLWLKCLTKQTRADIYISGISMGCATVLSVADKLPAQVKGVVADCGFLSVKRQFRDLIGLCPLPLMTMLRAICRRRAGFDFYRLDTTKSVAKSRAPIIFIHGGGDKFVRPYMSKLNYEACGVKKQLLIVEGAGHPKSHFVAPRLYEDSIDRFFGWER